MQTVVPQNSLPLPVRIGHLWFKWRSLSPVPLFLLFFFLKPNFILSGDQKALVLTLIFLAEGIRVWAVSYAGSRTRTRGDNVIELVHAGPYRYVRNPLYIANILMYSLVGVFFGFTYLSLFVLLYSALQYSLIVRFEESVLERDIGEPYKHYKKRVARWIPSFSPSIAASSHQFNLMQGLRSERSTFYSMLGMVILYYLKQRVWG